MGKKIMDFIDYLRENIDDVVNINTYIGIIDENLIREFKDKIDWSDVKLLDSFDFHSKALKNEFKEELRELREAEERRAEEKLKFTSEMILSLLEDIK